MDVLEHVWSETYCFHVSRFSIYLVKNAQLLLTMESLEYLSVSWARVVEFSV